MTECFRNLFNCSGVLLMITVVSINCTKGMDSPLSCKKEFRGETAAGKYLENPFAFSV